MTWMRTNTMATSFNYTGADLEAFIKYAPLPMAMLDTSLRYLHASHRWLKLHCLEHTDIIGRPHFEVLHNLPEPWKEAYQRCLKGNIERLDEVPHIKKDGSVHWLRWEAQPWYHEDRTIGGVILLSEDVTEYREAREALRRHAWDLQESKRCIEEQTILLTCQAEKLKEAREHAEAANKAKSNFLACVGHEIRTPMNGVIGIIELLLESTLTADQRELLQIADVSSRTLLGVLNDILDYSKIEAGQMKIQPIKLHLAELLHKTLRPLRIKATQKSLHIEVVFLNEVPDQVATDDLRFAQIINNLVGNAVKFTPDGGEIRIEVSLLDDKEHILFAVVDSGIGISPEGLQKIFDPFEQAELSTARHYGGTGLGLSITKNLVELLGGSMAVVSEVGFGSRFEFLLPVIHPQFLEQRKPEICAKGEQSSETTIKGRALIVEDNKANSRLAQVLLQREGLEVEIAENGREALAKIFKGKTRYDIIFMDCQMPEMDGYEATKCIRAHSAHWSKDIPIVALTAQMFEEEVNQCLEAGMNDFLSKPIDRKKLKSLLVEFLNSREERAR